MFEFDASELHDLSASLGRVSGVVVQQARGAVFKGAMAIKEDTRRNIPGRYWGPLVGKVNFDIVGLSAIVGYEDSGQGELAGIYEFGSSRRAPHPTLYPAADREAPKFERALLDLAAKAVEDL